MEKHVAQDFYRYIQVLIQNLGVKARAFLSRKCVELAADIVEGLGYFSRTPVFRTLEKHVFNEM
jgi:hypothetical protein